MNKNYEEIVPTFVFYSKNSNTSIEAISKLCWGHQPLKICVIKNVVFHNWNKDMSTCFCLHQPVEFVKNKHCSYVFSKLL